MARANRVTHKGTPLIHIDLSNLKPGEFKPVFAEAMRLISVAPARTARVVTDVEGARFDAGTIGEFEKFVSEATPHCAANAVVGVTGIRRVAFLGLKPFFKCPVELHDTVESGKDWAATFKG